MDKKISVVIIAQDEEERIASAVKTCLPFADEVLVVDGGSRDDTRAVAERAGARVVVNPWPGYANQRNHGASLATNDWIFWLDSDEEVDDGLAEALLSLKKDLHQERQAFAVYRIGDFWGKWLHSAREKNVIRMYNKKVYSVINTPVHEKVGVPSENVRQVHGVVWHRGFRSIDDHVARFNRYTRLEAQKDADEARQFSLPRLFVRPIARFVHSYFYRGLFRYGMAGLAVAYLWFIYEVLRELKLYELQWRATVPARGQSPDRRWREHATCASSSVACRTPAPSSAPPEPRPAKLAGFVPQPAAKGGREVSEPP